MELCLYDGDHGYYSSNIRGIGSTGDFSTSATLSSQLGRSLAAWISACPGINDQLIELGAGTGELARATRNALRGPSAFTAAGLLRRVRRKSHRYNIVERSPSLREAQQKTLGRQARWHNSLEEALLQANGKALIFSNELVDAFPVRVFRNDDPWSELFLSRRESAICECWQPAEALPSSTAFAGPWADGQVVEVHESYHQWLQKSLSGWKEGQILTIDYGGSGREIYQRRPEGTRRAYYHHERLTGQDLYRLPGRQDLTADVNFDDLIAWGEEMGLHTVKLTTQEDWLKAFRADPAMAGYLTSPYGAGEAFKVLLQEKTTGPAQPGF